LVKINSKSFVAGKFILKPRIFVQVKLDFLKIRSIFLM